MNLIALANRKRMRFLHRSRAPDRMTRGTVIAEIEMSLRELGMRHGEVRIELRRSLEERYRNLVRAFCSSCKPSL